MTISNPCGIHEKRQISGSLPVNLGELTTDFFCRTHFADSKHLQVTVSNGKCLTYDKVQIDSSYVFYVMQSLLLSALLRTFTQS